MNNELVDGIHSHLANAISGLIDLFENESIRHSFAIVLPEERATWSRSLELKLGRECYLTVAHRGSSLMKEFEMYDVTISETENRHLNYSIFIKGRLMDERFAKMHDLFSRLIEEKISEYVSKKLQSLILQKDSHLRIFERISKL